MIKKLKNKFKKGKNIICYFFKIFKLKIQLRKSPIIIGGCGRSGTTLLISILSSHPDIYAIKEETRVFCPGAYSKEKIKKTNIRIREIYKYLPIRVPKSCNRWCEKTPKNVLFFRDIIKSFKNKVKIIHIVRDGRDVVLSKHPSKPNDYWVSVERWVEDVSLGLECKNLENVYTLRYEDLILNYKEEIKKICNFLEIDLTDRLLNWHNYATLRESDSYFGEVEEIFKDSLYKYKKKENKERIDYFMKNKEAVNLLKKMSYLN